MNQIKKLTWWKLILIQILGIGLFILMAKLGIGQPFASIVGPKNDKTIDLILLSALFGPIIIGWYMKVNKWWMSAMAVALLFIVMALFYSIKVYRWNKLDSLDEILKEEPMVMEKYYGYKNKETKETVCFP